jgi:hypothetical protein
MTWFNAKKDGNCSHCGVPVEAGDRMWAVRRGYYVCEADGLLREASTNTDMGRMESSVVESLKAFPPEVMGQELAQGMLYLARLLDHEEVNPRDVPTFQKEMRQTLAQLEIMFPPEPDDDATADVQKQRESRMNLLKTGEWDD